MRTQTFYICDTCGSKFDSEAECIQHETMEHNKYSLMDDKELSNKLREIGESIKPAYRITRPEHTADNSLVYLPTDDLHCLMTEASKRLHADYEGCMSD